MSDILANQKVQYEDDSKQRNQGTVTVKGEDHTLGNVVRYQLLQDPRVRFAGYKKPHHSKITLRSKQQATNLTLQVQTNGELGAPDMVATACSLLSQKLERVQLSFSSSTATLQRHD